MLDLHRTLNNNTWRTPSHTQIALGPVFFHQVIASLLLLFFQWLCILQSLLLGLFGQQNHFLNFCRDDLYSQSVPEAPPYLICPLALHFWPIHHLPGDREHGPGHQPLYNCTLFLHYLVLYARAIQHHVRNIMRGGRSLLGPPADEYSSTES